MAPAIGEADLRLSFPSFGLFNNESFLDFHDADVIVNLLVNVVVDEAPRLLKEEKDATFVDGGLDEEEEDESLLQQRSASEYASSLAAPPHPSRGLAEASSPDDTSAEDRCKTELRVQASVSDRGEDGA